MIEIEIRRAEVINRLESKEKIAISPALLAVAGKLQEFVGKDK